MLTKSDLLSLLLATLLTFTCLALYLAIRVRWIYGCKLKYIRAIHRYNLHQLENSNLNLISYDELVDFHTIFYDYFNWSQDIFIYHKEILQILNDDNKRRAL